MKNLLLAFAITLITLPNGAYAHGEKPHARKFSALQLSEEHAFGKAGDPKKVDRTIAFNMTDNMRFNPAQITVKQGETIRFVVRNSGKVMHEMVIGTMKQLKEHAEQMKKFPGMEHDDPYMAHVPPGKTEEIIWQFTKAGDFDFACLIAGHFEAGMLGKIRVSAR
ncbi:MAG: plastocyanin/azurin family copper-binding protein [Burkholderiales bacterium]